MARLCERPGCSEVGAIAYGFDPARLLVWLTPFDPAADRNRAGVLCLRHADAMVVPVGWSLDDARDPTPRLFKTQREPRKARQSSRRRASASDGSGRAGTAAHQLSLAAEPTSSTPAKTTTSPKTPGVASSKAAKSAARPKQVAPVEPDQIAVAADAAATVAGVTGVAAAKVDDPDATTALPWKPDFDVRDDLDGLLDARSPLLGRAFRGDVRPR